MATIASCSSYQDDTWKTIVSLRLTDVEDLQIFRKFKASLARIADLSADALSQDLETMARNIEKVCDLTGCSLNYLSSMRPALNQVRNLIKEKPVWTYEEFKSALKALSKHGSDVRAFPVDCDLEKHQPNFLQALPNPRGAYASKVGVYSRLSNQFPEKLSHQEIARMIITANPGLKGSIIEPKYHGNNIGPGARL